MPDWKISVITAFYLAAPAYADIICHDRVELLDGKPIQTRRMRSTITITFDGSDKLLIQNGSSVFQIFARTPAVASLSPSGNLLALNFGKGSGQVYDLEVIDTFSGKSRDIKNFRAKILVYARNHRCKINADQISIVVNGWRKGGNLNVRTEDFSRASGCSSMNRSWKLRL